MIKLDYKKMMPDTGNGGGILITPNDLLNAGNKVLVSCDDLKKAISTIRDNINNIESSWSDATAKKYLDEFRSLEPTLVEFENAATSYGEFLVKVYNIYQKNMEANNKSVGGVN